MGNEKNVKTSWEGLWLQGKDVYSGKTIKKSDIPAYAKLIIQPNKYWKEGSSRPKYVYCFANGDAGNAITLERSKEELASIQDLQNRIAELEEQIEDMYTRGQVDYAERCAAEDGQNGYTDVIASDYL